MKHPEPISDRKSKIPKNVYTILILARKLLE